MKPEKILNLGQKVDDILNHHWIEGSTRVHVFSRDLDSHRNILDLY